MKIAAFLGTGNMGGALARAAVQAVGPREVIVANRSPEKAEALSRETGCDMAADVCAAVAVARYLFLGVKPHLLSGLVDQIRDQLRPDQVLVSMAAGVTLGQLEEMAPGMAIIRIMPNMPCAVGMGTVGLCRGSLVTEEQVQDLRDILMCSGVVCEVEERNMDAFSAVAGCGPAFAFQFIEALADGGVLAGLPRKDALRYAASMLKGSAEMVLATGKHPGVLKDEVCSPGGSTIEGVALLERRGFRSAVTDSVEAAWRKNQLLGK